MSSTRARSSDFGRLAETYDYLRPVDERWLHTIDRVVELGDLRGRRILDVGCGTGRLAIVLAERHGAKVWGIDPSSEMLDVARREHSSIGWKLARAEALPFRDAWFERAVTSLVVHHLDRPTAFREIRRVLASDGRFVISAPNPDGFDGQRLAPWFPSFVATERSPVPRCDRTRSRAP